VSDDEPTVSWDEVIDPLTRISWKEIDELKAERDHLKADLDWLRDHLGLVIDNNDGKRRLEFAHPPAITDVGDLLRAITKGVVE